MPELKSKKRNGLPTRTLFARYAEVHTGAQLTSAVVHWLICGSQQAAMRMLIICRHG